MTSQSSPAARGPTAIRQIRAFAIRLPLSVSEYAMSHDRVMSHVDTTVVEMESADGTRGYGEACTLGSSYLDGFAGSTQSAIHELARALVGRDVREAGVLNAVMDRQVKGHYPAKAALDAAGWDLRGRLLGLPVYTLLGGRQQESYPVFHPVTLSTPEAMAREVQELAAREGYRHWQLKLGNDAVADAQRVHRVAEAVGGQSDFLTSDANGGWSLPDAIRFARAVEDVDTYVEQPCATLSELAHLRGRVRQPIVVDEAVVTAGDLLASLRLGAAEALNIKPARVGGLTKAARLRDLAHAAGVRVMVDDPMGGMVAMAGIAHLAVTCEPGQLLAATHMASTHIDPRALAAATGGPAVRGGRGWLGDAPGLGVEVDAAAWGPPLFAIA